MEGPRLPPSATFHESDDDKSDDPPSAWHRPTSSLSALPSQDPPPHHWRNHSLNLSPILATPPRSLPPPHSIPELETYVVQVPRDQVYWTPPPEHAKYVEERRNNPEKNKKNGCSKRLMWFFIILIFFGFIIGAITLILHFVFNPTLPVFAVERLTVKPNNIEITFRAENPTSNMEVSYMMEKTGMISLTYKNKSLGRGKFPKMSQAASGSDNVNVKLNGSTKNAVMPPRGSKQPVSLVLMMELKADYEAGPLIKNKEVVVTCDVKFKGLLDAKKVEIVSENCESEFKN
ncbi:NDR1/HIN1-like protein 13 [Brassica napus]|uniref:NDR1/HIN1-like protein 13 n=1 Tax=Brassica napus TaxID=3708 RepID=UPI002078867E|nr:NDR1/HIN1-like protein 13 [Brassica napus]